MTTEEGSGTHRAFSLFLLDNVWTLGHQTNPE